MNHARVSASTRRIDDTLELAALLGQAGASVALDAGRTYVARSVALAQGVTLTIPATTVVELTDTGLTASSAFTLNGVTGVTIQGDGTIRGTSTTRTSVYGLVKAIDSSFLIDGPTLHTSPGTAVWTQGGQPLARNLTVYDTAADGIHFSRGATNYEVSGCTIHDTGDDAIGIVAYTVQGYPLCVGGAIFDITAANCGDPLDPTGAGRGIAAEGAVDLTIASFAISDVNQAGIIITGTSTERCDTVAIGPGTIDRVGLNVPVGGVGDGIYVTYSDTVNVTGVAITDTDRDGIRFVDTLSTGTTESGNSFTTIGSGINVNRI